MKFRRQHRLACELPGAVPVAGVMFLLFIYLLHNSALLLVEGTPLVSLPDGPGEQPTGLTGSAVVAMDSQGQLHFQNHSITLSDLQKRLMNMAAKAGSAPAQYALGMALKRQLSDNNQTDSTSTEAGAWLNLAARQGHPEAMNAVQADWVKAIGPAVEARAKQLATAHPGIISGKSNFALILKADRSLNMNQLTPVARAARAAGVQQVWLANRPQLSVPIPDGP